ncbi:hypothetical protein [Streptomyces sp. NPDC052107]|uniref:hypothetical protein n=1 Tax=Streptomyces sp. NPDC052107 TaxID=3155632 RepID=UPI0034481257
MALPDLDDLIAEVDRRCDTAHLPARQEQFDWLALLTVAAELAGQLHALADDLVEAYVEHLPDARLLVRSTGPSAPD